MKHTRQEEYEAFIGCNIPTQVNIHPPNDVRSAGRSKRIRRGKEMNGEELKEKNEEAKAKVARSCKTCNQVGFHDSRNCPNKKGQGKEVMNVHVMHTELQIVHHESYTSCKKNKCFINSIVLFDV